MKLQEFEFDWASLASAHPPIWRHPHKRAIYDLVRARPPISGVMRYTRWERMSLPEQVPMGAVKTEAVLGFFSYTASSAHIWHLNFADPRLFAAYGSPLMAQDEWQVLEHPLLASLREFLLDSELPALTRADGVSTPVVISNVPRQCAISLYSEPAGLSWWRQLIGTSSSHRPMYGNAFASTAERDVLRATRLLHPPTRSNIIAMSAPTGSGAYTLKQLTDILQTAFTGFSAANHEAKCCDEATSRIEINTGWWGCGAFGGNRTVMVVLQCLAAQMAGVDRLIFHLGDSDERFQFDEGIAFTASLIADNAGQTSRIIQSLADLGFTWGQSDGN
jgi:Poly (ADP-ribose) glycohydrolase (PARG)